MEGCGGNWGFYMKNQTKRTCHGMIISGGSDYSSQEMATQAKYLISVYMHSVYFQVVTEEHSQERMSLFNRDGN